MPLLLCAYSSHTAIEVPYHSIVPDWGLFQKLVLLYSSSLYLLMEEKCESSAWLNHSTTLYCAVWSSCCWLHITIIIIINFKYIMLHSVELSETVALSLPVPPVTTNKLFHNGHLFTIMVQRSEASTNEWECESKIVALTSKTSTC